MARRTGSRNAYRPPRRCGPDRRPAGEPGPSDYAATRGLNCGAGAPGAWLPDASTLWHWFFPADATDNRRGPLPSPHPTALPTALTTGTTTGKGRPAPHPGLGTTSTRHRSRSTRSVSCSTPVSRSATRFRPTPAGPPTSSGCGRQPSTARTTPTGRPSFGSPTATRPGSRGRPRRTAAPDATTSETAGSTSRWARRRRSRARPSDGGQIVSPSYTMARRFRSAARTCCEKVALLIPKSAASSCAVVLRGRS